MEFRLAQKTDLPTIVDIYNQIIPSRLATADLEPITVADRQVWFDAFDARHPLWMIEAEGQTLGRVGLEPLYGRKAYEYTAEIAIYLDEKARGKKVGTQALEFVLNQVNDLGISAIVAYIFGHNRPSLALFEKYGFERWGHLPQVAQLDGQKRDLEILGRRFD
ncbi:MAG: N-acetyltransferase family protein [Ligilactobacillus sp.]|nr:N-acetyltransferase family protein [Ligilactobacillus sp.]